MPTLTVSHGNRYYCRRGDRLDQSVDIFLSQTIEYNDWDKERIEMERLDLMKHLEEMVDLQATINGVLSSDDYKSKKDVRNKRYARVRKAFCADSR